MPDMTLVTRLMADSTQFTAGTERARASNESLRGSVQSIIGQLERQKQAFEVAGRSTLDWIEADRKASDEVKEHARNLLAEVDALNKVAAARKQITAGPDALSAMTKPDHFGRGLDRMKRQVEIDAERAQRDADRDARDPFTQGIKKYNEKDGVNDPFQRGLRVLSDDKAKQQADINARHAAGKAGDVWREEDAASKEHLERIRQHNLEVANARRAEQEIESARVVELRRSSRQIARDRRDNDNVMRQLGEQGYFDRGGRDKPIEHNRRKPNTQGMLEGVRIVEDFAAGASTGGLRGGLLGASNNISAFGASMGPYGAAIGAATSATVLLGSMAANAWAKNSKGAREAAEATAYFTKNVSDAVAHSRTLLEIEQERRGVKKLTAEGVRSREASLRDQLERHDNDIAVQQEAAEKQKAKLGAAGVSADELQAWRDERIFRQQEIGGRVDPLSGMSGPGRDATKWELTMSQVKPEALTDEFIQTQREYEKSLIKEIEVRDKLRNSLQEEIKKQRERKEQEERDIGQDQADRQSAIERSRRVGGRGPITEWEQMDLERENANRENAKQKERFERGQSWMQRRSEDLLLSGMKDEKDRAAYRAQKEHEESLLRSAEAEKMGVMTPKERAAMDAASLQKRDRDIRMAKYGDLQADGNSGFQSADVNSSQGFNAVMKAIRYGEQDKTISELKRNGDISEMVVTAVNNVATILQTAPVPVVDF